MATIMSFTSLQQSKRLAEILPLESADMTYCAITEGMREKMTIKNWEVNVGLDIAVKKNLFSYRNGYMIPCWSLSALLSVLPKIDGIALKLEKVKAEDGYDGYYYHIEYEGKILIPYSKNPVDACYEMIMRLHELKML